MRRICIRLDGVIPRLKEGGYNRIVATDPLGRNQETTFVFHISPGHSVFAEWPGISLFLPLFEYQPHDGDHSDNQCAERPAAELHLRALPPRQLALDGVRDADFHGIGHGLVEGVDAFTVSEPVAVFGQVYRVAAPDDGHGVTENNGINAEGGAVEGVGANGHGRHIDRLRRAGGEHQKHHGQCNEGEDGAETAEGWFVVVFHMSGIFANFVEKF